MEEVDVEVDIEQCKKKGFFRSFAGKLTIIIVIILIVIGGLWWFLTPKKWVYTNDAYIEGFNVQLSADMERRVIKLYVDEGDYVRKGDKIVDLEKNILMAQKRDAEANIAVLREQVTHSKIFYEKLRDDYIVAKREFESGIIAFLEFDNKEKDFRMSESQFQIAKASLENGIAKLGVIEAELEHMTVYASIDGMIAKRWILNGDVVQPGQPLFTLFDLENVWITANLEETKLEHVKIGSQVKIHVDAYPGMEFHGEVFVIKAAAASKFALVPPDNATGNFTKVVQRVPVKITLHQPRTKRPLYLFPGMSTEVHIRIRE